MLEWGRTQCPYCGVGCGLLVQIQGGEAVRVKGDADHPANFGEVCAKAVMLPRALKTPDRLLYPYLRSRRDRPLTRVPWPLALTTLAQSFRDIIAEYGPDAVAFYGSGQLLTEDYYVANKLAKGFLGTNNFDTNSRLCMASAAVGYHTSLGSDGPPVGYADIDLAECFFIIGSNTAECHPIVFRRLKRRKEQAPDEVKVISVDPRRTEVADIADLHLPLHPGADIALLNAMLAVMVEEGLVDPAFIRAHTQGWDELHALLARYAPEAVQEVCGLSAGRIREAARLFGRAHAVLSFWSMGLNQSTVGVGKNNALINLHLATGQIGKPGAGPFSLTGQPNAMGGREVGGLSHLLPGYRSVLEPQHRVEVAATQLQNGMEVKGFNVLVGGKLGSGGYRIASPLDAFVTPEQAAELCRAIVLAFRDHGLRQARNKARLAFFLEQCGVETFRAEVERALGHSLPPAGIDGRHDRSIDHVGIFRQKGQGLNYVRLSVPVGRLSGEQLFEVCRLAELYGTGEVRLTPGHNLIIPHVPDQTLGELIAEPLLQALRYDPSAIMRGLVSCTGIEFCNLVVIETKKRALDMAHTLEQKLGAVKPITIAWSGCPAGCGNHHVADIGLQGTKTKVAGRVVDAVTIFVGGKSGKAARLAEKILEDVPCDELPAMLEQLVRYYPRKFAS